jgi:hypothetical protein
MPPLGQAQPPKPRCFGCHRSARRAGVPRLRICCGCDAARYCGTHCQRLHWPQHSAQCKQIEQAQAQAARAAARAHELEAKRAALEALLAVSRAEAAASAAQEAASRAAVATLRAEVMAEAVARRLGV